MLLEFCAQNFLSIKDPITFSMNSAKDEGDKNVFRINVGGKKEYKILNSAVIYGPNGGGKSNLIHAMLSMRSMVINENKIIQSTESFDDYHPFRLSTKTEDSATEFEAVFFIGKDKYRYGFEYDKKNVYSEWLFIDTNGKESRMFFIDADERCYVNPKFEEGYDFFNQETQNIKGLRRNQLFLWKCDENAGGISGKIMKWFSEDFNVIDANKHQRYLDYTFEKLKEDEFSKSIKKLLKKADFGIDDIQIKERKLDDEDIERLRSILPKELLEDFDKTLATQDVEDDVIAKAIVTKHKKFNGRGVAVSTENFDINSDESTGTQKYFRLSGPIIDTLKNGRVLIFDEIDASLHPMLTAAIIEMFQDPEINTKDAQLIFSTHDTNLLNSALFRRDQIWFAEKDDFGASHIHSLSDIKGVRAAEAFSRQYLLGKYRAIPYIEKLEI